MEECRVTVQVHVVAVDRPKSSTKHADHLLAENTAEATVGMNSYMMVEKRVTRKKASKVELIQDIRKREMCRYLSNAFK